MHYIFLPNFILRNTHYKITYCNCLHYKLVKYGFRSWLPFKIQALFSEHREATVEKQGQATRDVVPDHRAAPLALPQVFHWSVSQVMLQTVEKPTKHQLHHNRPNTKHILSEQHQTHRSRSNTKHTPIDQILNTT